MRRVDLLQLAREPSLASQEENLNHNAQVVRLLLSHVQGPGHLYDLHAVFEQNRKHLIADKWYFSNMMYELADPNLSDANLFIALALLAPVAGTAANIRLRELKKLENEERARLIAEADARQREYQEKIGDLVKIDQGSTQHTVHQLWIASKREYLEYEAEHQKSRYHPAGYGTRVGTIAEELSGEHKGKFVCRFSRGTSSD